MQNVIAYLIRKKYTIIFLLLFLFSFYRIIESHSYHTNRFISSKNFFVGSLLNLRSNVFSYLKLGEDNIILSKENKTLREQIFNLSSLSDSLLMSSEYDSVPVLKYKVRLAKVIKNNYRNAYNYLTIDKGTSDGIYPDMGVISSNGIIGIIEKTSNHFSTIQSILNKNSLINAGLKGTDYFGTLRWDANNYKEAILEDIPKLSNVAIGDTVITAGMSYIFPKNIPIGRIMGYSLDDSKNYFIIRVSLFNDMSHLSHVYVIENLERKEILELEKQTEHYE